MFNLKQYDFKKYNYSLLFVVIVLCLTGAFMIYLVEPSGFKKQLFGIAIGLVIALIVSLVDYHFLARMFILLYIANIGLLIATRLFGPLIENTRRWIKIGPIQFQTSEISKVILIIFLAQLFECYKEKLNQWWAILAAIVLAAIPTAFILKQPDLSSSMVSMFIFVVMIFVAGLSYKIIFPVIMVGAPTLIALLWYVQQPFQKLLTEYQQNRILSILNPNQYGDLMYQQNNSIAAIRAGGLYGKLFRPDTTGIRLYNSVPVRESDFIFSVIGEELGFLGCLIFFGLFSIVIFKSLSVARNATDRLGMLIATGVSAMFMFQVFVNIGVATSILPNTGLPLPFISSGLSSLVGGMIGVGLLLNICICRNKVRR